MNAIAQLSASLTSMFTPEDSGLASDPTSKAFQPIIGKPLTPYTVTKVVDGKKVVKANRKPAAPKVEKIVAVETTTVSNHDEWVAMQAENLRCAGFGKDDLQIVDGKRFKLQSSGKTLTWFTERQWAEDILAAL